MSVGLTPEISALGLALGILLSLVCYLLTNLSPGGMITPGWLALVLLQNPQRMILIVEVTVVTYLVIIGLQRLVILYGKRLFATVATVAVFLQITFFVFLIRPFPNTFGYSTLGFIVPGLVAYQLIRQPILPTVAALGAVTATSYFLMVVGVLIGALPGGTVNTATAPIHFSALSLGLLAAVGVAIIAAAVFGVARMRRTTREAFNTVQAFDPLEYISASERRDGLRQGEADHGSDAGA